MTEILEGENTLAEISNREGISSRTLRTWWHEFIENAGRVFSVSKDEREARKVQQEAEERSKRLAEKVGWIFVRASLLALLVFPPPRCFRPRTQK